ncbi:DUF2723 domain-containing protein, partial [Dysgonomonas sp. 511]|uniref:protein O-mannosyl-transferase family n=1 Tax=Dysgonomonas sp. 511 TaxID=2302930 RepID=UPI0013D83B20|nr:DUF2723 domain-containing protein [Dysgonomonas sp. 511]
MGGTPLAYTFTDTFWYSAVEGEVYAYSSMFTALGSSNYLGPFNRLIPDNGCHHAFAM